MTRYCKNDDFLETKLNLIKPTFDEFGREKEPKEEQEENERKESEDVEELERGNELWTSIKNEYKTNNFYKYSALNYDRFTLPLCEQTKEYKYVSDKIFPTLMPGLLKCLKFAEENRTLVHRTTCGLDPVDFVVEHMHNSNPKHPERNETIFETEKFKEIARDTRSRFMLQRFSRKKEDAAVVIQKHVRGWLARKKENVDKLRAFWKSLYFPVTSPMEDDNQLQETYQDIELDAGERQGLSFEEALEKKMSTIEEEKKKRMIEEKIKALLKRAEGENKDAFGI